MHKEVFYVHHKTILFAGVDLRRRRQAEEAAKQKGAALSRESRTSTSRFLLLTSGLVDCISVQTQPNPLIC